MSTEQDPSFLQQPQLQLVTLSRAYVLSRAIQTIAKLDIADQMSDEPIDVKSLAIKTNTKPDLLERLLSFLSAHGVFMKHEQGFSLTELSKPLQAENPHSVKAAIKMVDENWWKAFAHLDQALTTGKTPFNCETDQNFFDFLQSHPDKQENFDRGMARLSSYDDEIIVRACNFGQFKNLMDIGGGKGGLVLALAKHFPNLPLMLFETKAVLSQLAPENFPKNLQLVEGDFLKEIPQADAYICKGVLHDFNDELVKIILKNCRKNMNASGRLFIAEQVIPDTEGPHPNKTMDIVMMVLLGGRQRTLQGWKNLLEESGFSFCASYPTESLFTVMEFTRNS